MSKGYRSKFGTPKNDYVAFALAWNERVAQHEEEVLPAARTLFRKSAGLLRDHWNALENRMEKNIRAAAALDGDDLAAIRRKAQDENDAQGLAITPAATTSPTKTSAKGSNGTGLCTPCCQPKQTFAMNAKAFVGRVSVNGAPVPVAVELAPQPDWAVTCSRCGWDESESNPVGTHKSARCLGPNRGRILGGNRCNLPCKRCGRHWAQHDEAAAKATKSQRPTSGIFATCLETCAVCGSTASAGEHGFECSTACSRCNLSWKEHATRWVCSTHRRPHKDCRVCEPTDPLLPAFGDRCQEQR